MPNNIAWTDKTWNPFRGCRKVSAGCKHCYMYRIETAYGRDPSIVIKAEPKVFNLPLSWRKRGLFVFPCSMSDFFIEDADEWRDAAWDIMRRTPNTCYLLLTKRPENVIERLPNDWEFGDPNIWIGASAENQRQADIRIPQLMAIPAAKRFVSYGPALGPITLADDWKPDWVICEGESGYGCRPMNETWATWMKDQCVERGIPFWFKQWGGYPNVRSHEKAILEGRLWQGRPEFEYEKEPEQIRMF